jgi:hypothetical protein
VLRLLGPKLASLFENLKQQHAKLSKEIASLKEKSFFDRDSLGSSFVLVELIESMLLIGQFQFIMKQSFGQIRGAKGFRRLAE